MAAISDEAIVLRRLDYSETSQVLVFLTRAHGQRRLIAKGIKRSTKTRFAAAIDMLERGRVLFYARSDGDRALGTLSEWRQAELYLGLRRELSRWYGGQYAAEITAALTEEADPHPELFDALAALLARLAELEADPADKPDAVARALVRYQQGLLTSIGLYPDLARCVPCGKPAPIGRGAYFSAGQGGLICRDCEPTVAEKQRVTAATLTGLRGEDWAEGAPGRAFALLDYTIGYHLGRKPQLSGMMLNMLRSG